MSEFQLIPEPPELRAARLIEAALNDKRLGEWDLSAIVKLAYRTTIPPKPPLVTSKDPYRRSNTADNEIRQDVPVDLSGLARELERRDDLVSVKKRTGERLYAATDPSMDRLAEAVRLDKSHAFYPTVETDAEDAHDEPHIFVRGQKFGGDGQANTKRQFPDTLDEAAQVRCMIGDPQLQDVLALHIADSRPAGVQMLSSERVIAWIGDVQQDGRPVSDGWRLWLYDEPTINTPLLFRDCRGANALEQAAKWLYEQWELRS